jgi:hypothetical protein
MPANRFTSTPRVAMAAENEGGTGSGGGVTPGTTAVAGGRETSREPTQDRAGEQRALDAAPASQNAAPPPDPAPKNFPDTWRHEMAAGDKAFLKTLDRFQNPAALAKAYKELTSKLSSGELRAAKSPGNDATPDQVAAWRIAHNLPEDAAAYVSGLKLADGTVPGEPDQPLLASFAEQAMKGNWTAEQYNQAVGWYFAMQDRQAAQRQFADGTFKQQASTDLVREWGNDYAVNRNTVVQFFDRNFPQEFKIDLLNARLPDGNLLANHPAFNKAMLEVAKTISPRGTLLPNASGAGLSNVDSRIAEIEAKHMRAAQGTEPWKTYWTGEAGARMQQEYRGLLAAREQTRRAGAR